jgi:L-alanine-DL-glutamate epimerase-like enolase superfamily enzyme
MMRTRSPAATASAASPVGVLDMALWDAAAKLEGVPLWRLLADRFNNGQADETAWVYAAGGYYYPGKGVDALVEEMKRYLGMGYSVGEDEDWRRARHADQGRAARGCGPHRGGAEAARR